MEVATKQTRKEVAIPEDIGIDRHAPGV